MDTLCPTLAALVGARVDEVTCMGTLTANLHLLMNTFYKPSIDRNKIICEAKAFPSDQVGAAAWARAREIDVIRISSVRIEIPDSIPWLQPR